MARRTFTMTEALRPKILGLIRLVPVGMVVEIRDKKRSIEQNAAMWAKLGEIAQQMLWYGERLEPDEWKQMFTAALRGQRIVRGIDNHPVALGVPTSTMTDEEMGLLLTSIDAWAAENGVVFKERKDHAEPRG